MNWPEGMQMRTLRLIRYAALYAWAAYVVANGSYGIYKLLRDWIAG